MAPKTPISFSRALAMTATQVDARTIKNVFLKEGKPVERPSIQWPVAFAFSLLLAIGVGPARSAQTPAQADEKAVAARSLAFLQAALKGDAAGFSAFMSDDYVMLWAEPAGDGKKPHWATKTKQQSPRRVYSVKRG